jgi:hypothetical protein
MKIRKLQIVAVSAVLLALLMASREGMSDTSKHASGLTARITLADGTKRTVTLDGAGCSETICSQVFIQGRSNDGSTERIWFDRLAAIRDIAANSALFIMGDGSQKRLSLITDFRVLYLNEGNTKSQKLDLSKIQSLEMLSTVK